MFKISASRVSAPTAASAGVAQLAAVSPQAFRSPCAASAWDYLTHSLSSTPAVLSSLDEQQKWDVLQNSGSELARVEAAVSLGRCGGFAPLVQAVNSPEEGLRRAATWGLAAGGAAVFSTVLDLLSGSGGNVVGSAAFALGSTAEYLSGRERETGLAKLRVHKQSIGCL